MIPKDFDKFSGAKRKHFWRENSMKIGKRNEKKILKDIL
jgi:hypothetical protein